jgi:hypothetical protein
MHPLCKAAATLLATATLTWTTLAALPDQPPDAAKCRGGACRACKTCSSCAHCHERGGGCSKKKKKHRIGPPKSESPSNH